MPYCSKCGNKVREEMTFCPNCGAPIKVEQPPVPVPSRAEKAEKREKGEKGEKKEKTEKYEKREFGVLGPLIGGLILIFLGLMLYLQLTGFIGREIVGAFFLVIIGIMIMVAAMVASRRHPRT